ncbi:unnamed protein product [Parascedosporium putredinis]|uniref:Ornithine cyclodeaminase n=1 Tax=Parascedosporium putredinis TaxID=1442378 RepID=A0A9P1HCL3_9PEZI|nr:unnamed protein product [Parascedosporium putredinis]CAI8004559.1 unnamed protein product [Parascedosporium putredinis]
MPLTILTNDQVKSILENLTLAQLDGFQRNLSKALHEYSTDVKAVQDGTYHQPQRTSYGNPQTGATTLFMPSVGPAGMGVKVVTATGFVNAGAITAFRTALASSCLLRLRGTVQDIVVFGAGKQAYWHLRLALLQHGATVSRVTVINRSESTARQVLADLGAVAPEIRSREGWQPAVLDALTPDTVGYAGLLQTRLREADVIFAARRQGKTRLVVAVGSYTPDMRELPQELLLQSAKASQDDPIDGGAIIVDTLEGVLSEAGEIIHAKVGPSRLVELGEVVDLDQIPQGASLAEVRTKTEARAHWLRNGNVIYKSVGLGLMDLTAGGYLLQVANDIGLGTRVEDF